MSRRCKATVFGLVAFAIGLLSAVADERGTPPRSAAPKMAMPANCTCASQGKDCACSGEMECAKPGADAKKTNGDAASKDATPKPKTENASASPKSDKKASASAKQR